VAATFSNAQTAGNLIVVAIGWSNSTSSVSSVTDTGGNTYTRAVGPTAVSGVESHSIYYAKNIVAAAAGANTVTVTFNAATWYPDIRIAEYSGIDTVSPLDATAGASGNSATSNSGSVTTTNANDLIVGANVVASFSSGAGSGYTQRILNANGDVLEDRIVTSTGSYSATAPLSPSGAWVMSV
jgi:hypothetical protein